MNDRDRTAPIALARDAPVAQPELHLAHTNRFLGEFQRFEPPGDLGERRFGIEPVEEPRVDHDAVAVVGGFANGESGRFIAGRHDDRHHGQPVFAGKIKVALVARRAAENGARAVFHQHEVGDVEGDEPVFVEGVHDAHAGVEPALLCGFQLGNGGAHAPALVAKGGEFGVGRGRGLGQRMIRRNRQERGAKQRVGPGSVDLDLADARSLQSRRCRLLVDGPADQHPFRAADPVGLHEAHLFRPFVERLQGVQQLVRVARDGEEPLRQLALLNDCARAPAATVDDLLVGEHRFVDRVPVDLGGFAVGDPFGQHVEEQLLLVPVIAGIAGSELALPIERQPH